MRPLSLAAFVASATLLASGCATDASSIERADVMTVAHHVATDYATALNDNDRTAFGALFAPDARYVNLQGQFLRGRAEIVSTYWATRGSQPAGVRTVTHVEGARAITGDAIVEVMRLEQVNMPSAPGGIQAARLTLTLAKRGRDWVIVQAQASAPG